MNDGNTIVEHICDKTVLACVLQNPMMYKGVHNVCIFQFQIERQLNTYLRRVEDVLGKGWESHVEGQRLKEDGDNFKQKLDTQELFEDWSRKVHVLSVSVRFFSSTLLGTIYRSSMWCSELYFPEISTSFMGYKRF